MKFLKTQFLRIHFLFFVFLFPSCAGRPGCTIMKVRKEMIIKERDYGLWTAIPYSR